MMHWLLFAYHRGGRLFVRLIINRLCEINNGYKIKPYMKKIILIVISFLALYFAAHAQPVSVRVLSNEQTFGTNIISNTDINGVLYTFPQRIHDFFLDTTTGYISLQLRNLSRNGKYLDNNGKLVQFDPQTSKVIWSMEMYYASNYIQHFNNNLITGFGGKSTGLDLNTGNKLWTIKNGIMMANSAADIGIGYRYKGSSGYTNDLRGIDMRTGAVKWERFLEHDYGWNEAFYINDSTLIVASSGLHAVNLRTGRGWDYHALTGKKDYTGMVAANAAGLALGFLTGTFVVTTGHDVVTDLVSNTLIDNDYIYFATREEIVKLNKNTGELAWQYPIPKDMGSQSALYLDDNSVYMINKGLGNLGNRKVKIGEPFVAAFNRETGVQEYFSFIKEKELQIISHEVINDQIFLLFANRIMVCSMADGQKLVTKDFNLGNKIGFEYFTGSNIFIERENKVLALFELWPENLFVVTTDGKVLSINSQLEIEETIEKDELMFYHNQYSGYKLISKADKCSVIDEAGNRVAELKATPGAIVNGDLLYDKAEKALIVVDLREVGK